MNFTNVSSTSFGNGFRTKSGRTPDRKGLDRSNNTKSYTTSGYRPNSQNNAQNNAQNQQYNYYSMGAQQGWYTSGAANAINQNQYIDKIQARIDELIQKAKNTVNKDLKIKYRTMAVLLAATIFTGGVSGYAAGNKNGYTGGYQEGNYSGFISGKAKGVETGRAEGYETGYNAGKADGIEIGAADGYKTAKQEYDTKLESMVEVDENGLPKKVVELANKWYIGKDSIKEYDFVEKERPYTPSSKMKIQSGYKTGGISIKDMTRAQANVARVFEIDDKVVLYLNRNVKAGDLKVLFGIMDGVLSRNNEYIVQAANGGNCDDVILQKGDVVIVPKRDANGEHYIGRFDLNLTKKGNLRDGIYSVFKSYSK